MKRVLRCSLSSVLLWTFVAAGVDAQVLAVESAPILILQVVNLAQVPTDVLQVAKKHVQWIYSQAGIETDWLVGADEVPSLPGRKTLLLRILLAPESVARRLGNGNKTVAGYALSTDGKGIRAAYVFTERAKKIALVLRDRPQLIAEALVLGQVIAHEVGHLMLPPGHSRTGLMQARMDGGSLDEALYGELYFTSNQSQLIRTTLLVQSRD